MAIFRDLHRFSAQIKADPRQIPGLRDRFIRFCRDLGIEDPEVEGWKLVFSEVVANAVIHGSRRDESKAVTVGWWRDENGVFLEVRDSGTGPAPERAENPELPDDLMSEGGRGLFIIAAFCDKQEHWRGPDGYITRLSKNYDTLHDAEIDDPEQELILDELADAYENLALFDRLGSAVAGGESLTHILDATLRIFREAGRNSALHLEAAPNVDLPEFRELESHPIYRAFGPAKSELWDELKKQPYLSWNSGKAPIPFASGSKWVPEGFAVPLLYMDSVVGILAEERSERQHSIHSRSIRSLRAHADILGIGLARSIMDRERADRDRIRLELSIATNLQRELLPLDSLPPKVDGWDLFYRCHPANEVAGDFAEMRRAPDGSLVGCLIDVMGKGVTAAILAGIFRSHFISLSTGLTSVDEFCNTVNATIEAQLNTTTMFITATVFRLYPETGTLEYACPGHPPSLLIQRDGTVRTLEAMDPPLGLFAGHRFQRATLQIEPDERFVCVTDGFFEWPDGDDLFGVEKMIQWFHEHTRLSAPETWDKLLAKVLCGFKNAGADNPGDDITLLLLHRF